MFTLSKNTFNLRTLLYQLSEWLRVWAFRHSIPTRLGSHLHPNWKAAGIRPARGPGQLVEGPCRRSWPAVLEPCTGPHHPPAGRSPPDLELPPAEGAWGHMAKSTLLSCCINRLPVKKSQFICERNVYQAIFQLTI